mmetsp:Transcript_40130/g.65708  ORF Transcript_40130/g.65708 Transcript_40130/m.65708 type:complete len:109 (+) Transcript_40130:288-614(+)
MIQFFKANLNFERLELCVEGLKQNEYRHSFVSALAKFDSLEELNFRSDLDNDDDEPREVIQALTVHSGLKKLVLGYVRIGRNGYTALTTLLQNLESKLTPLCFTSTLE